MTLQLTAQHRLYLDTATDLLAWEQVKVVPGDSGNGYRTTAGTHIVEDEDQLLKLVRLGMTRRAQGATRANAQSSRSHAIVQLFVTRFTEDGFEMRSVVNIVDLAGSERVSATHAQGDRLREACAINKSLSTLSACVTAVAQNRGKSTLKNGRRKALVPFRESKLTMLLSSSFAGTSMTHMICCASPSSLSRNQTKATLDLANLAKGIKSIPRSNKFVSRKEVQRQLTKVNKRITEVNRALIEADDDVATMKARLLSLLANVSGKERAQLLKSHPVIEDLDKMGVGRGDRSVGGAGRCVSFCRARESGHVTHPGNQTITIIPQPILRAEHRTSRARPIPRLRL